MKDIIDRIRQVMGAVPADTLYAPVPAPPLWSEGGGGSSRHPMVVVWALERELQKGLQTDHSRWRRGEREGKVDRNGTRKSALTLAGAGTDLLIQRSTHYVFDCAL